MEQEKLTWRDNKSAARAIARGHLSADCAALLDRLLEMDEVRRAPSYRGKACVWHRCGMWFATGCRVPMVCLEMV